MRARGFGSSGAFRWVPSARSGVAHLFVLAASTVWCVSLATAAPAAPPAPVDRRIVVTGEDADRWRRLVASFRSQSVDDSLFRQNTNRGLGARLLDEGFLSSSLVWKVGEDTDTLLVTSGPAATWDRLDVRSSVELPSFDDSLLIDRIQREAADLHDRSYDETKLRRLFWDWIDAAGEIGRPFALATVESLLVRDGQVRAGIAFDSGARVRLDELSFPGARTTRQDWLARWLGFVPGEPYRASTNGARRERMESLSLFARIDEERLVSLPGNRYRLELGVAESPQNLVEAALAVSGRSNRTAGNVLLEFGNLFGRARRLDVRWARPRAEETRLAFGVSDPSLGHWPLGARVRFEQELRDSTWSLARIEGTLEFALADRIALRGGGDYVETSLGPEPAESRRRTSSLLGFRLTDRANAGVRGGRFEVEVRSGRTHIRSREGLRRSERLTRAEIRLHRAVPLPARWVLGSESRAAGTAGGDSLPSIEAFRVGGSGSLRGYREESFLARRFALQQFEVGPPVAEGSARVYAFVDVALLWPVRQDAAVQNRTGFGLGLESRQRAAVRVDLGFPGRFVLDAARLHFSVRARF